MERIWSIGERRLKRKLRWRKLLFNSIVMSILL